MLPCAATPQVVDVTKGPVDNPTQPSQLPLDTRRLDGDDAKGTQGFVVQRQGRWLDLNRISLRRWTAPFRPVTRPARSGPALRRRSTVALNRPPRNPVAHRSAGPVDTAFGVVTAHPPGHQNHALAPAGGGSAVARSHRRAVDGLRDLQAWGFPTPRTSNGSTGGFRPPSWHADVRQVSVA